MIEMKRKTIPRDISWLSFNGRVLQEAADTSVPLKERVKFLGIFSNNLDEFFRVRVATLKRMAEAGPRIKNMHLEQAPADILEVMEVSDWAAWEQLRDTHPTMKPVLDGFSELVDPATVRTYFTHVISGERR